MKPPVEAPTSRQSRPATSMPSAAIALSSLIPPRETKRGALLDAEIGLGIDQLAGPQRDRPVLADPDLAGPDRAGGGRARRKEAPLGQNRVYSRLGARLRHAGTVQPSSRQSIRSPCQMFSETLELGRTIASASLRTPVAKASVTRLTHKSHVCSYLDSRIRERGSIKGIYKTSWSGLAPLIWQLTPIDSPRGT